MYLLICIFGKNIKEILLHFFGNRNDIHENDYYDADDQAETWVGAGSSENMRGVVKRNQIINTHFNYSSFFFT